MSISPTLWNALPPLAPTRRRSHSTAFGSTSGASACTHRITTEQPSGKAVGNDSYSLSAQHPPAISRQPKATFFDVVLNTLEPSSYAPSAPAASGSRVNPAQGADAAIDQEVSNAIAPSCGPTSTQDNLGLYEMLGPHIGAARYLLVYSDKKEIVPFCARVLETVVSRSAWAAAMRAPMQHHRYKAEVHWHNLVTDDKPKKNQLEVLRAILYALEPESLPMGATPKLDEVASTSLCHAERKALLQYCETHCLDAPMRVLGQNITRGLRVNGVLALWTWAKNRLEFDTTGGYNDPIAQCEQYFITHFDAIQADTKFLEWEVDRQNHLLQSLYPAVATHVAAAGWKAFIRLRPAVVHILHSKTPLGEEFKLLDLLVRAVAYKDADFLNRLQGAVSSYHWRRLLYADQMAALQTAIAQKDLTTLNFLMSSGPEPNGPSYWLRHQNNKLAHAMVEHELGPVLAGWLPQISPKYANIGLSTDPFLLNHCVTANDQQNTLRRWLGDLQEYGQEVTALSADTFKYAIAALKASNCALIQQVIEGEGNFILISDLIELVFNKYSLDYYIDFVAYGSLVRCALKHHRFDIAEFMLSRMGLRELSLFFLHQDAQIIFDALASQASCLTETIWVWLNATGIQTAIVHLYGERIACKAIKMKLPTWAERIFNCFAGTAHLDGTEKQQGIWYSAIKYGATDLVEKFGRKIGAESEKQWIADRNFLSLERAAQSVDLDLFKHLFSKLSNQQQTDAKSTHTAKWIQAVLAYAKWQSIAPFVHFLAKIHPEALYTAANWRGALFRALERNDATNFSKLVYALDHSERHKLLSEPYNTTGKTLIASAVAHTEVASLDAVRKLYRVEELHISIAQKLIKEARKNGNVAEVASLRCRYPNVESKTISWNSALKANDWRYALQMLTTPSFIIAEFLRDLTDADYEELQNLHGAAVARASLRAKQFYDVVCCRDGADAIRLQVAAQNGKILREVLEDGDADKSHIDWFVRHELTGSTRAELARADSFALLRVPPTPCYTEDVFELFVHSLEVSDVTTLLQKPPQAGLTQHLWASTRAFERHLQMTDAATRKQLERHLCHHLNRPGFSRNYVA